MAVLSRTRVIVMLKCLGPAHSRTCIRNDATRLGAAPLWAAEVTRSPGFASRHQPRQKDHPAANPNPMTALRTTHSFSFPFGITKAATVSLDLVKKNAYINAFTSLVPDEKVLSAALAAEKRESPHKPMKSVFDGRLVAIKDNIVTTDLPTTCGSEMLRGGFRDHVVRVRS
jgi:hypothetical protein